MLPYISLCYIALYETNEKVGYLGLMVKEYVGEDAQKKSY